MIGAVNREIVLKSLDLPKMSLELKSDGIVYCKYNTGVVVFTHDVDEGVEKRVDVFGDQERCFLVDIENLKGVSSDAKRYFTSEKGAFNIKAAAFYSENGLANDLVLEFIEENNPPFPARVFMDYTEARDWLLTFESNSL